MKIPSDLHAFVALLNAAHVKYVESNLQILADCCDCLGARNGYGQFKRWWRKPRYASAQGQYGPWPAGFTNECDGIRCYHGGVAQQPGKGAAAKASA